MKNIKLLNRIISIGIGAALFGWSAAISLLIGISPEEYGTWTSYLSIILLNIGVLLSFSENRKILMWRDGIILVVAILSEMFYLVLIATILLIFQLQDLKKFLS